MLIDTHAHITDKRYEDVNQIIADMDADGLGAIITVGYDLASSRECLDLAKANSRIFCAVGVHPSDASTADEDCYNELIKMATVNKCVAIGEVGLDYYYENTDRAVQKIVLERQLRLVKKADLPVVLHLRDAFFDMYDIIKANLELLPKRGVLHCFSGSVEEAKKYLDMGFYLSFGGPITFKNARVAPEVIQYMPRDRILAETDCPYLTPHPHRGKLNYPKFVRLTVEKIAEFLGIDFMTAESITTQNALNCFERLKI